MPLSLYFYADLDFVGMCKNNTSKEKSMLENFNKNNVAKTEQRPSVLNRRAKKQESKTIIIIPLNSETLQ